MEKKANFFPPTISPSCGLARVFLSSKDTVPKVRFLLFARFNFAFPPRRAFDRAGKIGNFSSVRVCMREESRTNLGRVSQGKSLRRDVDREVFHCRGYFFLC